MTTNEVAPSDTEESPELPGQRVAGAFTFAVVKPLVGLVVPLTAVAAALGVGAVMLLALGANPLQGYAALFDGAFGSWDALADTAIKAMPLLLVGVGICIAFRAGVINIGGEGQIILGAIFSTTVALLIPDTPRIVLVPLVLIAGAIGGGIWGAIPGALKAYAGVSLSLIHI